MNSYLESLYKGCCVTWVDSTCKIRDNLSSLRNASNQHQSWFIDVKMEVEVAKEDMEEEVMNEVEDCMGKAEAQVWIILQQDNQEAQVKLLEDHCLKNCGANYKLEKVSIQKYIEVWDLMEGILSLRYKRCLLFIGRVVSVMRMMEWASLAHLVWVALEK